MITKLIASALLSVLAATLAFAQSGSPNRTQCDISAMEAKQDIKEITDINELYEGAKLVRLGSFEVECNKYQGEVTTCENTNSVGGLDVSYRFNTQNGTLEIQDSITGQEATNIWTNAHGLTKSGFIYLDTDLTNRRGGLLGESRFFMVSAHCGATGSDWDK